MRVMVFVKATEDREKDFDQTPCSTGMTAAMSRFNGELSKAGVLLMAKGRKLSSRGRRVGFDGPEHTVLGAAALNLASSSPGFRLWEVKDIEDAVAWV